MLGVFSAMEVAASGLSAERTRMNTVASNLANARTTRTEAGGPYKRLDPVFQAVPIANRFQELVNDPTAKVASVVEVRGVQEDQSPPQMVYDPAHPDADPN